MSSFAPEDNIEPDDHRRQIARAANAALRGESHNTGRFTLPAGALEFELLDPRIGAERVIFLSPVDTVASGIAWWMEDSDTEKGRAVLRFKTAPPVDCTFNYAIVGTKRFRA